MSSKFDIKIEEVAKNTYHVVEKNLLDNPKTNPEYNYTVPVSSKLQLKLTGADVNNIIVNTIRRVLIDDIPSYAFCSDLIKITDNTSVFNNDMMRVRLEQLPVINVELDAFFLENKYWKNVDYSDPKRNKHPKEKMIELSVTAYNDTNSVKNITTNHIKFYEDGEEIPQKYNKDCPILLVQLRPAETFKCSMRAAIGIGLRNNIWSAVSNAYYDDNTTNSKTGEFITTKGTDILFTVESLGQFDEYDCLIKACKFIKKKLEDIKNDITTKVQSKLIPDTREMIFVFENEDHTIGQLINDAFQDHPNIMYSGVSKSDHFVRSIKITIVSDNTIKSPYKAMVEQIDMLKNKYEYIEKQFVSLNKNKKTSSDIKLKK